MWSNSSRTEHHPIQLNQRPHLTRRRPHLPEVHRRPPVGRLDYQANRTNTRPSRQEQLLQRVELQQAPPMAAPRIRQGHVRGRGPHRHPEHRPPVRLPADDRVVERRPPLQLGADASGTFRVHVPDTDGHHAAGEHVHRQRPGLPQRHVPVVAPPPEDGEPAQVLRLLSETGTPDRGGRVRAALPRAEAVEVLQGLRLQLGPGDRVSEVRE